LTLINRKLTLNTPLALFKLATQQNKTRENGQWHSIKVTTQSCGKQNKGKKKRTLTHIVQEPENRNMEKERPSPLKRTLVVVHNRLQPGLWQVASDNPEVQLL
jgi:hypothetical protein